MLGATFGASFCSRMRFWFVTLFYRMYNICKRKSGGFQSRFSVLKKQRLEIF